MLFCRNAEGIHGQRKVGKPCYSVRRTGSCRYGKWAFLFCHRVWALCWVAILYRSFAIRLNRADATRPALDRGAVAAVLMQHCS